MVDINLVRENPEKYKKATAAKQVDPSLIDKLLEVDKKWREQLKVVEELRAERNALAKKAKDNMEARSKGQNVKNELKKVEPILSELADSFESLINKIPNPPSDDVKEGKDDTENDVVRTWGEPRKFEFKPKDHLELGEKLGIIDVESASKVSGARFAYLKGDGVRLEMALVQYALETLSAEEFVPVIPPALIKKEMMAGMGYLEHGGEEDMFTLDKDGLVLIGTSEQSIGPMHANETLNLKDNPLRYVGYSPCFRREAGSYGKDTRGIIRVHQFDKVEMFSFTKQEDSDKEHDFMLSLEEKFLQALNLPYQVVKMCSGDLGTPAARKYDLEAWIPTQEKYRELTSTSTCTDYQARGLNIKYQEGGETKYAHMLNGTAFAIGRTIVAILENNQNEDGSVTIPEALQKYMGKEKIT